MVRHVVLNLLKVVTHIVRVLYRIKKHIFILDHFDIHVFSFKTTLWTQQNDWTQRLTMTEVADSPCLTEIPIYLSVSVICLIQHPS